MMPRKSLLLLAVTAVAGSAAATGLAIGSSGEHTPKHVAASQLPAAAPVSPEVLSAFPAFGTTESSSAKDAMVARIQQSVASDPDTPEAQADLGLARSITVGTGETVWMAPSDDRVCVFIPDPVDGFGASCPTLDQIRSGHGTVLLGPSPAATDPVFVVAVPTPEGAAGPEIVHADGSHVTVTPQTNLAVAEAAPSDAVRTGDTTLELSALAGSPAG